MFHVEHAGRAQLPSQRLPTFTDPGAHALPVCPDTVNNREAFPVAFLFQQDPLLVAFTALGFCILAIIIMLIVLVRQSVLLRRYRSLLKGNIHANLEDLLIQQQEATAELQAEQEDIRRRLTALENASQKYLQRVGIVRYSAFPDVGADLSFSCAILDGQDNGVVVTSLYGRSECRTYAKPILGGASSYVLTDEEKQAIELARGISNRKV